MFESGNVVRFKNGPQTENLWGDKVELHYFLVSEEQEQEQFADDYVRVYSHPYRFALHQDELELVAHDEFEEFPNDFMDGWLWWDSLSDEEKDDYSGPNWLEYLGR